MEMLDQMVSSEIKEIIEGIFLHPRSRSAYYRFAHVMIELIERHGIRYFAHSGTMLGCVRHKGFIPWDDDIDVMIPLEDEPRLVEMSKELETYGVRLRRGRPEQPADGLWQFSCFGRPIMQGTKKFFGFDIFIGEEIRTKKGDLVYHYQSPDFRRWFRKRYVKVDDVFPRKRYPFGPLSIWGMGRPMDYFERSGFDLDCATIHVHEGSKKAAANVIDKLTEQGLYPIRDPEILNMPAPYAPTELWDLEHYRVPEDTAAS